MWNFIPQSGIMTATVDFTHDLSWLLTALVGVVWLSAGMLVGVTLRHYLCTRLTPTADRTPSSVDSQAAA